MKKSILLTLLVILALLSACSNTPPKQETGATSTGSILPNYIDTSDEIIKYNPDGSIDMGQITLPNGEKIIFRWAPATFMSAATEPVNSAYDLNIAAATEAIKNNPQAREAYITRAALYLDRGRNPEDLQNAVEDCTAVLKISDSEPAAYYIRGMAYAMLEDYERALSDFWALLIVREYENRGLYYILGELNERMNRNDEAIEMFRKVLAIDPTFADTDQRLYRLGSQ